MGRRFEALDSTGDLRMRVRGGQPCHFKQARQTSEGNCNYFVHKPGTTQVLLRCFGKGCRDQRQCYDLRIPEEIDDDAWLSVELRA
eukprot:COSAG01_NODE_2017_length_8638_cov_15.453917_11_plen_86_part_00